MRVQSFLPKTIYNYHYPKPSDIAPEQEEYIQNYISEFEEIMLSDDYTNNLTGYPTIMNVESFVDFILLILNNSYKSFFLINFLFLK